MKSKMILTVMLLVLSVGVSQAEVSVQSWSLTEMHCMSTARTQDAAAREIMQWLLSGPPNHALLRRDIFDIWRNELTAKILDDPNRYVISSQARQNGFFCRIDLVQLMRDVTATLFGNTTPRVAVLTQEYILRRPEPPDPAVETEMLRAFLEYGFEAVDITQARQSEMREALLQGSTGALATAGLAVHADIVVTGESFAEEMNDRSGFQARVELKAIETRTGRILAAIAEPRHTVRGPSPNVAAKEALEKGARDAAPRLAAAMLNSFGKPVTMLRVNNVRSLSDISIIRDHLVQNLPDCSVRVASSDLRGQRNAILDVTCKVDTAEIAMMLEDIRAPRILVDDIGCRYIVIQMR